jgi:hypothetical protein
MHVRIGQEKVRKLEEENATLRLHVELMKEQVQKAQDAANLAHLHLKEQMQKAHDAGKREVCCVCLFHTRMGTCVYHVSGHLCICR